MFIVYLLVSLLPSRFLPRVIPPSLLHSLIIYLLPASHPSIPPSARSVLFTIITVNGNDQILARTSKRNQMTQCICLLDYLFVCSCSCKRRKCVRTPQ